MSNYFVNCVNRLVILSSGLSKRMILHLFVCPDIMLISDFFKWKKSDKNSITASLALPSTAGARKANFKCVLFHTPSKPLRFAVFYGIMENTKPLRRLCHFIPKNPIKKELRHDVYTRFSVCPDRPLPPA